MHHAFVGELPLQINLQAFPDRNHDRRPGHITAANDKRNFGPETSFSSGPLAWAAMMSCTAQSTGRLSPVLPPVKLQAKYDKGTARLGAGWPLEISLSVAPLG